MSADARHAAQVASVVGSTFSFAWLAAMLELSLAALLGPVDELPRGELFVETGEASTFRHDLLREAQPLARGLPRCGAVLAYPRPATRALPGSRLAGALSRVSTEA